MNIEQPKYADGIRQAKQTRFLGLNHNKGAGDGELYSMKNLCSDYYPLLATRPKRRLYRTLTKGNGLYAWDKLCWVDGTEFFYNGVKKGDVTDTQKRFAAINGYIIIAPDMKYYNVNTDEFGSLESETTQNVSFQDGTLYEEPAAQNTIKAAGVNWADYFREGDAITITGSTSNDTSIIIREIAGDEMHFYEYSFTNESGTNVNFKRSVPDLAIVFENENRLWGCQGGTIYVSKLGDPFNFNVFDGLDTDSFAVEAGSAGNFSGGIAFRGYPTFSKEQRIYRMYGSTPSNFEILGSATLGVAEGSGDSMAVAGESLLYLNRNGICMYKGGLPAPVNRAFGNERYKNAVAGSDGLKYYVSMEDMSGNSHLFVYDTQKGLWHEEDDTKITHFAFSEGNLYFLNDKGEIWITGSIQDPPESTEEKDFEWEAEFTDFTDESPNEKHMAKIIIRLELDEGAECSVWMQADSSGEWRQTNPAEITEEKKRSYYLAILPVRADHYRLKLTGKGGCRVYSLTREISIGSAYSRQPVNK